MTGAGALAGDKPGRMRMGGGFEKQDNWISNQIQNQGTHAPRRWMPASLGVSTAIITTAMTLALAAPASAADVTVNNDIEDPLATSAADNVSPGDITISNSGSVTVENGPAIVIDSNNIVTQDGDISVTGKDGAVGIRLMGGRTGSLASNGTITLESASDDDPELGTNKTAIELTGSGTFTGDITVGESAAIRVESDSGQGIALRTNMIGDLTHTGILTLNGNNGTGILVEGDLTGDVELSNSTLIVSGEDSAGVVLKGDVSGGFRNAGSLGTVSYVEGTVIDSDTDLSALPTSRGGVLVGGSLGGGFLNDGTDADIEGHSSGRGVIDANLANVAVQISPDVAGGANGDITIGKVGEGVESYGFINRGTITADGTYEGKASTAVDIRGSANGAFKTTVENGLRNAGTITAGVFDSDHSIGVNVGKGATVGHIENSGRISVFNSGATGGLSRGVLIEAGATTNSLTNFGEISASGSGDNADVMAIEDRSGKLRNVVNRGTIIATHNLRSDATIPDGAARDALNLTAVSSGASFTNEGNISGNIRLGSGNDTVHLTSLYDADFEEGDQINGSLFIGTLNTGAGNDTLLIDGGASVIGSIANGGGSLSLDFQDGEVTLGSSNSLSVTNAVFGAESTTTIFLGENTSDEARILVSNLATIEEGAEFNIQLQEFLGETASFALIDAGSLSIEGGLEAFDSELFYLYNSDLSISPTDSGKIILSLDLKDANELGLNKTQTSAYNAFVEALDIDDQLASAFGGISDGTTFLAAYDQLLPTTGLAARAAAIATTDQQAYALGERLDSLRRISHETTATTWFQIYGNYYEQDEDPDQIAFTGETYGIAGGLDYRVLGADALGVSFNWAGSTIQDDGAHEDENLRVDTIQLGAYGSWSAGSAFLALHGAGGYNRYRTNRFIAIQDDFLRSPKADWDGYQYSGSARTGFDAKMGAFRITPSASLDYLYVKQNAFNENGGGTGINLTVAESDFTSMRAAGEIELAYTIKQDGGATLTPSLRGGFRQELETDPLVTEAQFLNGSEVFEIISGDISESGVIGGLALAYDVKNYYGGLHLQAGYTGLVEDNFIRHSGGVNFRFTF